MCDTCPTHILGPGEVAGKIARTKAGRKVGAILFYGFVWTFLAPLVPFAVWGIFGWWTIALGALGLAAAGVGVTYMRVMHRHMVLAAPASLRASLPAPRRAVALPRNLAITRGRRALPVAAKALPAAVVEPTRIVAPVKRAAR